ncbi:MAG: COX15/CtaA family protein [Nitrososphaerota archaeon]|nr:COX15/CtaA family protein [Nitrososphaerota archaeon]
MSSARYWVYAAALAIYILNAWGAYVTLGGYGAGCGTGFGASWPLCNGTLFPALSHYPTLIEYLHRFLSVVTGLVILFAAIAAWRMKPRPQLSSRLMLLAIILVPIQVVIGGEVVGSGLSALIATTHFCFATAIFGIVTMAATLMYVDNKREGAAGGQPAPGQ